MARSIVHCPRCGTVMNCDDCTRIGARWVDVYLCPKCGTKHNAVQPEPSEPREAPQGFTEPKSTISLAQEIRERSERLIPKVNKLLASASEARDDDWDEDDLSDVVPPASMPRLVPENGSLPSVDEFEALAEARRILEAAKKVIIEAKAAPRSHAYVETRLERAMMLYADTGPETTRADTEETIADDEWWSQWRLACPEKFQEYPLA